jgi:hypothetical protein
MGYGDLRISTRAARGAQAEEAVGEAAQRLDMSLAASNDSVMRRAEMKGIPT